MDEQDISKINTITFDRFPDEIIILILQNNSCREILNFAATCKRYNVMVKNHTLLWKYKCSSIFDSIMYKTIAHYYSSRWLHELKYYSRIKQKLLNDLNEMSPKYYWAVSEKALDNNVKDLFYNKTTIKRYFYSIHVLQNVIRTGNKLLDKNVCKKPYTLTEIFYAKTILRQYMHTFLAVKYIKSKLEQDITPETVVTFFLQWIDPGNLYLEKDVDDKIDSLVDAVNNILDSEGQRDEDCPCAAKKIMSTAYYVVFKERHIALTPFADLDTLNICKVIDKRYGNYLITAIIYQAVANRCGADCELLVYPGHFYVRWTDHNNPKKPETYVVDLDSGEMKKRKESENALKLAFFPDMLLHYLYSMYSATMAALRSWHTDNAMCLVDFLGTGHIAIDANCNSNNMYKNYNSYLLKNGSSLIQCGNLDFRKLSGDHAQIIMFLSKSTKNIEVKLRPKIVKTHVSQVKFAVGMICYHKKYDYVCIIRGWDPVGCMQHIASEEDLRDSCEQPFYHVIAADQSDRYVAQENLMELTRPTRLYHLEHQISREFTHFDGFAYSPNDLKQFEYPGDLLIIERYRELCLQKPNNM